MVPYFTFTAVPWKQAVNRFTFTRPQIHSHVILGTTKFELSMDIHHRSPLTELIEIDFPVRSAVALWFMQG